MSEYDLSVLIPARNEMFLERTVDDVLANGSEHTEIIVVLDEAWPSEPMPQKDRVKVIYCAESIGQRAATNLAAKASKAKFIMKLDAHCSVDKDFDTKLMAECEYDWTVIPRQYNLHVFDWMCDKCGHRTYQGPTPKACEKCRSIQLHREIVWQRRMSRKTTSWRFDHNLHFQYFGEYSKRPELEGKKFTPTMTFLGACWFMYRDRYWELGGLDEGHGSWGQVGVEVACKTWLSGGQLLVNHKTWFAHMFRTQGSDFSFPYPMTGSIQEQARKRSREIWLKNAWPKQIHPLSWLIHQFRPLPDWHGENGKEMLTKINKAGAAFMVVNPLASLTPSVTLGGIAGREQVPTSAMGSSGLLSTRAITTQDIDVRSNEAQVDGITTEPVIADMIDNERSALVDPADRPDQPSPHNSVDANLRPVESNAPVSITVGVTSPEPAPTTEVDSNFGEDSSDVSDGKVGNSEVFLLSHDSASYAGLGLGSELCDEHSAGPTILPQNLSKGLVYYTDNRLEETIDKAVKLQIKRNLNGHKLVSVSLKPMLDFGRNYIMQRERGILTMFKQILYGLEKCEADVVFLCEHDVLYHPSHFEFIPPRRDVFYYNVNTYKVDTQTGQALFYYTDQTSGLCAYRGLLIEHYQKRITKVEQNAADLRAKGEPVKNDGYSRHMGFEPGKHRFPRGVDNYKAERWMSEFPNVDIRHNRNLTPSRWRQDQFRNPDACLGWKMVDEVPGWGKTKGRFWEFLAEVQKGEIVSKNEGVAQAG